MKVKVIGPGCARCKATYEIVKKIVEREIWMSSWNTLQT